MTALSNTRDALGESLTTTRQRAGRIAKHGRHAAEDIASELRALMTELESALGESTQTDTAAIKTQLRQRLYDARTRLSGTREVVRDRAGAALHGADDYVHENPWRTLAIVGAVALIAGALVARGGMR